MDAILGTGAETILKDVQHARARGFLALALVSRQPNRQAYVTAAEDFLTTLPSRSPAVQEKGLKLARFALHWLDPNRAWGDWERLKSELIAQLDDQSGRFATADSLGNPG